MTNNVNLNYIKTLEQRPLNSSLKNTSSKSNSEDLLEEFSNILSKITSVVKKSGDNSSQALAKALESSKIDLPVQKETLSNESGVPNREEVKINKDNNHFNENIAKDVAVSRNEVKENITREEPKVINKEEANNQIELDDKDSKKTDNNDVSKEAKKTEKQDEKIEEVSKESLKDVELKEVNQELELSDEFLEKKDLSEVNVEEVITTDTKLVSPENISVKGSEQAQDNKEKVKKSDELLEEKVVDENIVKNQEALVTKNDGSALNQKVNPELNKNLKEREEVINNGEVLNKEDVQTENLKVKVINELDKKLSNQEAPKNTNQKVDKDLVIENMNLENATSNNLNSLASTPLNLGNVGLNSRVSQEIAMKNIIQQAKDVLLKQVDLKGSASSNIQNVQASINNNKSSEIARDSKPTALPKTYANRTISKVEEVIKELSKSKDGKTISVRLDPPSLGSVKVDVSYKDGSLTARIMAESNQVGQFLKDKALDLQQLLRKTGINVDEVNVWFGSQSEFKDSSESSSSNNFENDFNDNNFQAGDLEVENNKVLDEDSSAQDLDHWVA